MKIVLLMDNPIIPTGYASTCRLTAYELVKKGHEVYAVAFNGGHQADSIAKWNGINIIPNYALQDDKNAIYGNAELITRIERDIAPDIYFFHNDSYRYSYLDGVNPKILRKSVFWLPFEGMVKDVAGLKLFNKFAATRFVTNHALNIHKDDLKGKNIGYIPHAVDLANLAPTQDKRAAKVAKKLGVEDKFVVLRVDRHQPRKYWDRTLMAFAKFAEGKDDVFLLAKCNPRDCTMCDPNKDPSTWRDLGKLAEELGISDKIRFEDFFFDDSFMASAFYHAADVFLTTTSGEGFGLTPTEAMACGVPVIYPDTPVLPEVVAGGGVMAKVEGKSYYEPMCVWHNLVDIDDAASKLQWAYDDWKKDGIELAKIGAKGREIVISKYDPETVYDQWNDVFQEVIERDNIVSVVTVLYNLQGEEQIYGEDGIDKFRDSLEKYVTTPYEWIIVENGSPKRELTRKWLEEVASKNRRIKPVYSDVNLGFGGGCNLGIAQTKGKWVVLSNPDSEALDPKKQNVPKDYLGLLVDKSRANPKAGIIGMEINKREDILPDAEFPYFCNVLITRACLDAVKKGSKWFDEKFWPAYYEDLDFCMRAKAKGFDVIADQFVPFYHKSGGTNKYAIEGNQNGPYVQHLENAIMELEASNPELADFARKKGELASGGMQGLIKGNIAYLNEKWGSAARSKIKLVWETRVGDGVGFSQIVEGLCPELEKAGFDVYINDWANMRNVEDPQVRRLIEKYQKANVAGELDDAIHVVCWLMETFLNVDADYKIGISLCESTKVRESYLQACNGMDRILTFSNFCKNIQKNSGFTVPIDVIAPGVHPIYLNYYERPEPDYERGEKFSFLSVGVCQGRKDTHRLVQAFCETFPKNKDRSPETEDSFPLRPNQVELVIKSNNFGELNSWIKPYMQRANIRPIFTGQDARAERPDFSMQEMYDLYCSANCLVHPSHGEGIGMPILEGAATGLPVIFTNWSSPAEYLDESNSLPCSLSPYEGTTFTKAYPGAPGDNGVWANCFPAETPVRTVDGTKNIEDIRPGDMVLTHRGRYRKVTKINSRHYEGDVFVINGMLNNHKITVTPEHPFLCVKTSKCWYERRKHVTCKPNCKKKNCSDELWKNYEREFVNAEDLTARDSLVLPFVKDEKTPERIDVFKYAGQGGRCDAKSVWLPNVWNKSRLKKCTTTIEQVAEYARVSRSVAQRALSSGGKSVSDTAMEKVSKAAKSLGYKPFSDFKKVKRFVKIDEDFGRLAGFYLAEGSSSVSRLSFSFHKKETEYVDEVRRLMKRKFGISGSLHKNGRNGVQLAFYSTVLCRMFKSMFGSSSHTKKMPDSWAFLPKNVARGIVYAMWRGDGCTEKLAFSYKTSSKKLAYQMNALCLKLGIVQSILKNNIGQYVLKIGEKENTSIAASFLESKDFSRKNTKPRNWRDNDYVYLPIHDIKKHKYSGSVFNMEVEEDNTYCVAHSTVHNCHIGHLKHLMMQVIRERKQSRLKGVKAAEHIKKNYNWENTAKNMIPLVFEWEEERRKKNKNSGFDPLTFEKPSLQPVKEDDRVIIDIVTRDRHSYLCALLVSLLDQTYKNWDIIIQCDDADESMPNDHQIMSLMARFQHEGHGWRIIRSHRQGPHIAHDRSLQMAAEDPRYKYKLLCRIDDDITLKPDYLENLFKHFVEDRGCELAAVSGVYLDPKRPDESQMAPQNFENDVEYAGLIDHNVPWPYVCRYPEGTPAREVEHLYSSFMYRVEVATAIGGYCRRFSQIGHREESDFSYRFHLAGFKQLIEPKAVGYHFSAPAGGIRSEHINDKHTLAKMDHEIYLKRIAKWKKRALLRKQRDAGQAPDSGEHDKTTAEKSQITKGKLVAVINGTDDIERIKNAVNRTSEFCGEIYVTSSDDRAKEELSEAKFPQVKMVATSPDEAAMLTQSLASQGDHEFIMTISDTMRFESNPVGVLNDTHDDYVFEVFTSYMPGKTMMDVNNNPVFVQDNSIGEILGPEVQNKCLIYRRTSDRTKKPNISSIQYVDIMVIDDQRVAPVNGKSSMGNELIPLDKIDTKPWRKFCVYQYPEGKLDEPRFVDVEPSRAPLVSIIIPTTNRLQHLKKCIFSIYSRTSTPFELVVVDNGSTDGTAKFLADEAEIRDNMRVLTQGVNLGYQKAINLGVSQAKGEYLLLFNDDAWVESRMPDGRDWLGVLLSELKNDPKLGLVGPHGGKSPALGDDMLFFWCVMMRASLYEEVGPLDDISFRNYGGDDDYCQRVRGAGYGIRVKQGFEGVLRHLMNLEPEEKKEEELRESRIKLQQKYEKKKVPQ